MDIKKLTDNIVEQVSTDLNDLFDKNFDDEGFFGNKWKKRKSTKESHPILGKTSNAGLRGSINKKVTGNEISFTSSKPYASIHNEGGIIKATQNVNPFSRKVKGKTQSVKGFSRNVSINMPQRQFIGDHPKVKASIENIIDMEMKKFNEEMAKTFRQ